MFDPPYRNTRRKERETTLDPPLNKASVAKCKVLRRRYERAVDMLEVRRSGRVGIFQLAWWAMRTLSSAIALVRGEELLMANACWIELSGPPGAPAEWRARSGVDEPERRYSSLRQLAIAETARLTGNESVALTVLERAGSNDEQLIELRVERIERPGSEAVAVVMAHDVTERTRAERELDRAKQALAHQGRMRAAGELASGVAHDLNNVLSSLVLRAAILQADATCMALQGENIDAIVRILKDATARVGHLQELSRRPRELAMETLDIGALIREAIDMVRAEIEDKASFAGTPIRIAASLPELPCVLGTSAADLRHMFINLVLNARDAMPMGGAIQIEGTSRGGNVIVTIADDGTGIQKENIPKIFDPFFTTKGDRGTGLGLSNADELMSVLGGKIEAANRLDRSGAIFTLTFPIAVERLVSPRHAPAKASPGQRILVIDDDPDHLMMTKAVIELEEQQVEVASSGRQALERLRGGASYDLILCDAGMPDLNGWQVAEAIRALAPETKVYLLTGWSQELLEADPRRAFVSGVLPKPMNLDSLRTILSQSSIAAP